MSWNLYDGEQLSNVRWSEFKYITSQGWICMINVSVAQPNLFHVVLAIIPNRRFGTGSGSEPNRCWIGSFCSQSMQTVHSCMVQWKCPKPSELGGWSAGRPAGPSVDSYNALVLQSDNSFLSKSCIQQPIISFCMFCNLPYQLFWNLCFSFYMLYCSLERWSIVLLWSHVSAQCLDYPICKTKNGWRSIDAHFHDGVMHLSCTVSEEKTARTFYMNYFHKAILKLAKMRDKKSLTLHWHSLSGCGREGGAIVFASKGGQYHIYGCLQPIAG